MPTGKTGWESRLGGGHIALCYADGPTWRAVTRCVVNYEGAGYDILRIEVAPDVFQDLHEEGKLNQEEFSTCYMEIHGYPVYLNEKLSKGGMFVIERTESRA